MHELGIVFHIINQVEDLCKEKKLSKVASVTMQFGEVSSIIPDYLDDCWKWATNKSAFMKGCILKSERIPAVSICENCEKTFATIAYGKTCPFCKSEKTHLLSGQEIFIKQIEAC